MLHIRFVVLLWNHCCIFLENALLLGRFGIKFYLLLLGQMFFYGNIINGKSLDLGKDLPWDVVFVLGCWWLGQQRNEMIFSDSQYFQEHVSFVISQTRQCISAQLFDQNSKETPPKKDLSVGFFFWEDGSKLTLMDFKRESRFGRWRKGIKDLVGYCFFVLAKL